MCNPTSCRHHRMLEGTHEIFSLRKSNERAIDAAMELVRISRNPERVAGLAKNIAEEDFFMVRER